MSVESATRSGGTGPADAATSGKRLGLVLTVIVACQLMLVLDATIVNVALPKIQGSLSFSPTNLAWVLNAYTLAYGGLLLLGGRAGDILGRRQVLVGGIALFSVASLLGGLATESWMLVVCRAAQGVGAACASPNALALIASNFPEGTPRTKALAAWAAVSGVGGSIGLIVGGMLTTWLSWRWVMFINVPFGVAVLVLAPMVLTSPPRNPGRFDIAGAVTSTVGLGALVYAFIRAASDGWSDGQTIVAFAVAAAALALFVVVENRVAQPVVPLRLLADLPRARSYLLILLLTGSMLGMFFFTTQFVQKDLGFSALQAGFAFLPMTAGILVSASRASKLLKTIGPKPLMLAGALLTTAGMTWLTRISDTSSYAGAVLGPMIMFGLGVGALFVPLSVAVVSGVPARDTGAASSMMVVMQQMGGSVGLAVLVTVFGSATRDALSDPPHDMTPARLPEYVLAHGVSAAYTVATVFLAVILLLVLITRQVRPADDAKTASAPADAEAEAVES
ncbi:MFS transporter [Streptomyces sp. NRRL F-5123]|uniref:MFS transporter n=1 Tax=Streptomyces sp. NRRL F-5123 TaxID=1463856 RepID=UPI0004E17739|nr:MFS transporter [Streptomyces sp. NRRL F-5123]